MAIWSVQAERTKRREKNVANGGNGTPPFPPNSQIPQDLEEVEDIVGPHARLKIARKTNPGVNPRYMGTMHAAMFSFEAMLDAYGGGDYQVRVFDGAQYVRSFDVSLDYNVPPRDPRQIR